MSHLPQFPLYIVSKGRADSRLTSRALEAMKVPDRIIAEPQEVETYAKVIDRAKILPLDMSYKDTYETCDELGDERGKGPGGARNFAWQHSIDSGFDWHWVMDDNIKSFHRLNKNLKVPVGDGTIFRCMEDFVLRYRNVGMAGPNYFMFASRKTKMKPFALNTRIYSCNLIRNDLRFRWRGRYNEDTILSLDMLKAGWCTVQFNAFLQYKMPTQQIKGGNTAEFYHAEGVKVEGEKYARGGTLAKSEMLARVHPDVSKVVWKFGRWHHEVDYRPFKKTALVRREGVEIPRGANNYGMNLRRVAGK